MKYKDIVDLKLGETIWTFADAVGNEPQGWLPQVYKWQGRTLYKSELLEMGATPIESEEDDDTPNCPVCGMSLTSHVYYEPCEPKTPPVEIELSNVDFKSTKDWQSHFIQLEMKLNEIITQLNANTKAIKENV
jgi:hypothetical protein